MELICDGGASKCISHDLKDFIGPITPLHDVRLKGIDGSLPIKGVGTVKWNILDDEGNVHSFKIQHTLYVPKLPKRLFSPQHWASCFPRSDIKLQYSAQILSNTTILRWDNFIRTIPHHPTLKIAIFPTAPSLFHHRSTLAKLETSQSHNNSFPAVAFLSPHLIPSEDDDFVAMPPPVQDTSLQSNQTYNFNKTSFTPTCIPVPSPHIIPNDEQSISEGGIDSTSEGEEMISSTSEGASVPSEGAIEFSLEGAESQSDQTQSIPLQPLEEMQDHLMEIQDIEQEMQYREMPPRAKIIFWHYRLGHMSFEKI